MKLDKSKEFYKGYQAAYITLASILLGGWLFYMGFIQPREQIKELQHRVYELTTDFYVFKNTQLRVKSRTIEVVK